MIHTRKQVVTEARVREATVGMKEAETTNQAVWNDLFLPLSKKRVKDLGMDAVEKEKYVGRLARLVEASGAADKIVGGMVQCYLPKSSAERRFGLTYIVYRRVLPPLHEPPSAGPVVGSVEQVPCVDRSVRPVQLGDAVGAGVRHARVPPVSGRPRSPAVCGSGQHQGLAADGGLGGAFGCSPHRNSGIDRHAEKHNAVCFSVPCEDEGERGDLQVPLYGGRLRSRASHCELQTPVREGSDGGGVRTDLEPYHLSPHPTSESIRIWSDPLWSGKLM